jgi:hypothetical protein
VQNRQSASFRVYLRQFAEQQQMSSQFACYFEGTTQDQNELYPNNVVLVQIKEAFI